MDWPQRQSSRPLAASEGAGAVHALYGSPTGLAAAGASCGPQNSPGFRAPSSPLDVFRFLPAGDLDSGGFACTL
jgi:hypothetical protein